MNFNAATCHVVGIAPLSQSRFHEEPKLNGELMDAYERRTWRSKLHVATIKGQRSVVVPGAAMHQSMVSAARYSKRQIPGQGKATWTGKFASGIVLPSDLVLGIDPDEVESVTILAHADGKRGSGKRVKRIFPQIAAGWESIFDIIVLDPIITDEIMREMLQLTGMFVGLGRFRPENLGHNGRFLVKDITWSEATNFGA